MPSRPYMLSAASEKLQINFRGSLWSSMPANVTMPPVIAAAAEPHQRHSTTRRRYRLTSRNLNRCAAWAGEEVLVWAGLFWGGRGKTAGAKSGGNNQKKGLEAAGRYHPTPRD